MSPGLPVAGSPDDLAFVRAVEERAFNAWPALEVALVDGWLLRFAEGYTKRANSANPLAPTQRLASLLPLVETLYRRHGLQPCVRLTPLGHPDDGLLLDGLGWRSLDESMLLVAPLPGLRGEDDPAVTITPSAGPAWIEGYAAASRRPDLKRDTLARMLMAIRPEAAFATLIEDGEAQAFGMAVAERGMVGLFDIATARESRRRGYGRRIVSALMQWGRSKAAMQAYLQVAVANTAALALYGALGYRERYRYLYRVPPG